MDIDYRHCPHCKHDVLDWGLKCAGCGEIPRQTPEGKKAMAEARGKWLATDWAILAGFVVLAYFAVMVFVAGRGHKDIVPAQSLSVPTKGPR